jgi:two-component system, NarL family, nitrate/nitrite response regulator NarL
MARAIRTAIVDDHPLILRGVEQTLDKASGFEIIGLGTSAADAIRIAESAAPDVMLLDISMPGGGIEAARQIAQRFPLVKLVMLTVSERDDHLKEALEIGVRGYILKGISGPELQAALAAVHDGKSYITPDLATRALINKVAPERSPLSGFNGAAFNDRETSVIKLLLDGRSNRDIAANLGLSEKTIKRYVSAIMAKMGAKSRLEVVTTINRSGQM